MKTIADQIKEISWLLVIIIFFQSCSLYKRKSTTIEKVSSKRNTLIKIITKSGDKYKLKWIVEKDGFVYSIKNTKRVKIKKSKLNEETPIYIPELITMEDKGDYILGITMTRPDTVVVRIPIDQIEEIKLISYPKIIIIPLSAAIVSFIGISIILYLNADSVI